MEIQTVRVGSYSYSVVADGMEIAVVSGKTRRRAILAALSAAVPATWQSALTVARGWQAANPKAAR